MDRIRNLLKIFIINILSKRYVDYLRLQKKKWRHVKYRLRQKVHPVNISQDALVMEFKKVGLCNGDKIYFFSAMSKFGYIEGGAKSVIAAMEEVVGSDGLIAMPAFPIVGSGIDYVERGSVFNVLKTPSNMGTITETFRQMPNVFRSLHPTHSICAKGNGARSLTEGHENCQTPFGYGSPFMKMIEQNMILVGFGVGVQHFTLYHTFEDICGERFPFKVYLDQLFPLRCIDENGVEKIVYTPVHNPSLSINRIDSNHKKERQIREMLQSGGYLRTIKVSKGEILAINSSDFISELNRFLKIGITIYD